MRRSTGTWSASLLPPVKLYLGNPVHLAAGGGKDGGNKGAKSNDPEAMPSLSCVKSRASASCASSLSPASVCSLPRMRGEGWGGGELPCMNLVTFPLPVPPPHAGEGTQEPPERLLRR